MNWNTPPFCNSGLPHSPDGLGEFPAVAVCGAVSRFSQTTVVPTETARFSSVKLMISVSNVSPACAADTTVVACATGSDVGAGAGLGVGVTDELLAGAAAAVEATMGVTVG